MISSMTGYGRAELHTDEMDVSVELKSVNHRFFECACRAPRSMAFLEERLKTLCKEKITRGKLDIYASVRMPAFQAQEIVRNEPFAAAYIAALRQLRDDYGLQDDISVSAVARNSDVFEIKSAPVEEDAVWQAVLPTAQQALASFLSMRRIEGEKLKADVCEQAEAILRRVDWIESRSPETVRQYRARIEEKIRELLEGQQVDEQRLLTETAIFADKVAVAEETVRLRSHISQLRALLDEDGPIGKKLDFIVQEMNREANTIGSKAQDLDITRAVVEIKSCIEKIREQIQNIE